MKKEDLIQEANSILTDLPAETSWEDLMYRIYVRQKIERGIAESEAGEVVQLDEVAKRFAGGT